MHQLSTPAADRRLAALVLTVPLVAVVVAGCSEGGKPAADTGSPSARGTTAAPRTTVAPRVVPQATKVAVAPGTGKGFVGARKDVRTFSCTQVGRVWRVSGSVVNPSTATADYRIYTAFLTARNDTRGLLETDVTGVAAKAREQWHGSLRLPDQGLHCALRVERSPAK